MSWPKGILASFVRIAEQIELSGPHLGSPYTKPMGGSLFQIRASGGEGIGRALFCCLKDREIIILSCFIKKTQRTPIEKLLIAKSRIKEAIYVQIKKWNL